jgi:toxin ParE1/3/4
MRWRGGVNPFVVSPAAVADMEGILDYLKSQASDRVASHVVSELRNGMQRLADSPGIGHFRMDLTDDSLKFYRVYKYLIVYRSNSAPLWIVRVLHGSRDLEGIFDDFD